MAASKTVSDMNTYVAELSAQADSADILRILFIKLFKFNSNSQSSKISLVLKNGKTILFNDSWLKVNIGEA